MRIESIVKQLLPVVEEVGESPVIRSETAEVLPTTHRELLEAINGFTAQNGSLRILGFGRGDPLDFDWWNEEDTWRFAWDNRVDSFLFFGSTAWGDQYAYRKLPNDSLDQPVYLLEATLLRAHQIAESFDAFVEHELLRVARKPYDSLTAGALSRYGPIPSADQWTFAPSIALGGQETLDNVVRLPARDAMVIAGDIASALRASIPGAYPKEVQPWTDDQGRQRLLVRFDR